jgi:hypothetical protein
MRTNTNSHGHSHIRYPVSPEPSFDEGSDLGENHQKLAIPAGYVLDIYKCGGKKESPR